jgi:chromosome segregation protein
MEYYLELQRRLTQYWACDSVVDALNITNLNTLLLEKSIITKDGHLIINNCIVLYANKSNSLDNQVGYLLEYKNQLGKLEHDLLKLIKKQEKLQQEFSDLNLKYTELGNTELKLKSILNNLHAQKQQLEIQFIKEEHLYLQNQKHQEKITQEISLLRMEIRSIESTVLEFELQIETKESTLEACLAKCQTMQQNSDSSLASGKLAKNRLDEALDKVKQMNIQNQLLEQQINNCNLLITDKEQQQNVLQQKLIELTVEEESITLIDTAGAVGTVDALAAVEISLDELQIKIAQLINKIALNKEESSLNTAQITKCQHDLSKLYNQRDKLYGQINQLKFKQQEQQILLGQYKEQYQQHQEKYQQSQKEDQEQYQEQCQNQLSENQSEGQSSEYTLVALANKITELQNKINQLGLVNLKAIADLEQVELRYNDLGIQIEDLAAAILSLEGAIQQIDTESGRILKDTFTKVNESFAVYFKILFGGGEASLEFTDTDILNAGLQIFATPLGKKNSSIHLLSGGEKALTAMSLVFAFFNLNPSPFCLLDEVDAPLDDANTGRFCTLVQELSSKTQFVYISHNRMTMEMADQLIGVTMQEHGVSSVVSIDLVDGSPSV